MDPLIAELREQRQLTLRWLQRARRAGDDFLADALDARLAELAEIADRHDVDAA